jgi:hypothetical protein
MKILAVSGDVQETSNKPARGGMHMSVRLSVARNFSWTFVVVILALQGTSTASARIEVMLSIQEYFESADLVVEARIDSEEPIRQRDGECGIRYQATVLHEFKNSPQIRGRQLTFGRFAGLYSRETYVLFLRYETDPEAAYREVKERYDLPDPNTNEGKERISMTIKCDGLFPGLVYNAKTAWDVRDNGVAIEGILPFDFPRNIRKSQADKLLWLVQKDDLFAYLRSLGTIQK